MIEIIDNTMILNFEEDEPFNEFLINEVYESFQKMDPTSLITVELKDYVPIDIISYVINVSLHCKMKIISYNEEEIKFIELVSSTGQMNIEIIKGEKESNG